MINFLFRISVVLGLAGMCLGMFMGIKQDFTLVPAHAHLNLLGFVALFLSALYYRAVPEAAAGLFAQIQATVAVIGAVVFPIGIASVLLGGPERFEPVVVGGAITVLVGMLLFVVVVFRTSSLKRVSGSSTSRRESGSRSGPNALGTKI